MTLNLSHTSPERKKTFSGFDLDSELRNHGWKPKTSIIEAEVALKGQKAYTYLIRPSEFGRGFALSFVQANGYVKHDHFKLINAMYGIFLNGRPEHVGALGKVIRDMMACSLDEGQPLL